MNPIAGQFPVLGTTVAGYRIEALIGRGGMGAVYRAEEEELAREVALKVIAPELAQDEHFRERFLRESRIAASLDDPHVVPIYRAGEDDGVLYLAMRYVEGTDLARLLAEQGALEPRRALDLVSQVAGALDAAHEKRLVHRDVKPANVLISSVAGKEHCYLGDFGLTRRMGSPSEVAAGDVVGTLDYIAPEQVTGGPLDKRIDVYSLGCVLYECLTGQPPFPRATDVALIWAHVHEEPAPPSAARPGLPRELDPVLARALAKEPEARYASAGKLAAEARSALARAGAPRFERIRAHDGLLAAAASVALVAVAVLLFLALRDPAPVRLAANTVGVVDAATNELVGRVEVGREPRAIAAGEGAVWVVNSGDGTVMHIDSTTRRVVATIPIVRAGEQVALGGIAAGYEAAWLLQVDDGEVALDQISAAYNTISATVELGGRAVWLGESQPIAAGDGALWVVAPDGSIVQIDPVSMRQVQTFESDLQATDLAAAPGTVWVASRTAVAPVYPTTSDLPARIPVGSPVIGSPNRPAIAIGHDAVWVTLGDDDAVARIDLVTRAVSTIPVGDEPVDVAVGAGAVWVANAGDRTISRVDPDAERVVAVIELGARPVAVAVSGQSLWVSSASPLERSGT